MSAKDVERLEQDLTTFRHLLKTDHPFDRGDILPLLVIGIGALAALPILSMRLLANPRICLLVCLAPGIALYVRRYNSVRCQQIERPNLWQEYRFSAIVVVLLVPAVVSWIWWSSQLGLTRIQAGAPLLFSIGLAALLAGIVDVRRRLYIPVGFAVIALAVCVLLVTPSQIPIVGSIALAATTFGMAAWIFVATRNDAE